MSQQGPSQSASPAQVRAVGPGRVAIEFSVEELQRQLGGSALSSCGGCSGGSGCGHGGCSGCASCNAALAEQIAVQAVRQQLGTR